jgi:hypothetical protein
MFSTEQRFLIVPPLTTTALFYAAPLLYAPDIVHTLNVRPHIGLTLLQHWHP